MHPSAVAACLHLYGVGTGVGGSSPLGTVSAWVVTLFLHSSQGQRGWAVLSFGTGCSLDAMFLYFCKLDLWISDFCPPSQIRMYRHFFKIWTHEFPTFLSDKWTCNSAKQIRSSVIADFFKKKILLSNINLMIRQNKLIKTIIKQNFTRRFFPVDWMLASSSFVTPEEAPFGV